MVEQESIVPRVTPQGDEKLTPLPNLTRDFFIFARISSLGVCPTAKFFALGFVYCCERVLADTRVRKNR